MVVTVAPAPSAARGEVTLQPAYFTSSLFVDSLRHDILTLAHTFVERYARTQPAQPFALFKLIWNAQGWQWMHFKVLDARARETFLSVTLRLFLERLVKTEAPLTRVVALFGLYTFFYTQPSVPAPPLHSVFHIPLPLDLYTSLLEFPRALATQPLSSLRPCVSYVLKTLFDDQVFNIVPSSEHHALNPSKLPREVFVQDSSGLDSSATVVYGSNLGSIPSTELEKKKGRPTKRDKAKKAKDALALLEQWLDRTGHTPPNRNNGSGGVLTMSAPPVTTHMLLSNPPSASRDLYRAHKATLLSGINVFTQKEKGEGEGEVRRALERANVAVVTRLRRIDELAAERGLEVGAEGGERTGLGRVEKAASAPHGGGAGLLALMEGAGLPREPSTSMSTTAENEESR